MKRAFDDLARLGNQPCVLCVDTNMSENNAYLKAVVATGDWIDVAYTFSEGKPAPTYSSDPCWDKREQGRGITRPDRIFVNRIAFEMIIKYEVLRDVTIPSHLPQRIEFDAERLQEEQTVMEYPKEYEVDKIRLSEEEKEKPAATILLKEGARDRFQRLREEKKVLSQQLRHGTAEQKAEATKKINSIAIAEEIERYSYNTVEPLEASTQQL